MVLEPGEYYIYTADDYLDVVCALSPNTFYWITFDGEHEDPRDKRYFEPREVGEIKHFRKLSPLEKVLL